jgi:hypothetical protein
MVDKNNNPQIGDQQVAITAITDNTGGTPADAVAWTFQINDIATIVERINLIIDLLERHGLIAD